VWWSRRSTRWNRSISAGVRGGLGSPGSAGSSTVSSVSLAPTIGASENDASLVLLLATGEVVEWMYEETGRHADFLAYLDERRVALEDANAHAERTRAGVRADWDPEVRAAREAELLAELRATLASAAPPPDPPRVASPIDSPPPCAPDELVLRDPDGKSLAEVHLNLVLYLGAYPSLDEVRATYRAFRHHFPVAGTLEWRFPSFGGFFRTKQDDPDDVDFVDGFEPDDYGHFGLRASIKTADPRRLYALNVMGVPPATEAQDTRPRAGFCEVIVPASESTAALHALACVLLETLPVRSGHGGFAAYGERDDAANAQIHAWCRRLFGVDVGIVDGWLPGALTRLRGAAWLTVLGRGFATALGDAGRLSWPPPITLTRGPSGVVVRAGAEPSLGDVARGEFPVHTAAVERAVLPLAIAGYSQPGMFSIGGVMWTTLTEQLAPFASHHATAGFVRRLLDPQGFLETPRDVAEALLARLCAAHGGPQLAEWKASRDTGWRAFSTLLRLLYNASCRPPTTELSVEALEHAARFDDGAIKNVLNNLLFAYLERGTHDRALAIMPRALEYAEQNPSILHNAACIFVRAGDHARALDCVRDARRFNYENLAALRDDDDLAPLRDLPEYRALFDD